MSRTMLNEQSLPQKFWCNPVDTSTYILNQILIRAILGKTPYELLKGRKPTIDYFRVFGSKCFILNTKDYLTKFDPKSYEDIFLRYLQNSKAYIILNKHTRKVEESLNVTFDETPPPSKTSPLVDDDLDEEEAIKVTEKKNLENDIVDETLEIDEINLSYVNEAIVTPQISTEQEDSDLGLCLMVEEDLLREIDLDLPIIPMQISTYSINLNTEKSIAKCQHLKLASSLVLLFANSDEPQ
ncbi:retrovirus-related pol polyprotein from transposon TNT 1-94 [Tanacetum coccineum]